MSPRTARSISSAVVGGLAAMVFFWAGLYFWIGVMGWAAVAEAREDPQGLKRTIAGMAFGAFLAWLGIAVSLLIPVPADGWLWMPRLAVALGVALFLLEMGTKADLFSRRSACLLGFAAVIGVGAVTVAEVTGFQRFTSVHLYNPLLAALVAQTLGAIAGQAAESMHRSLATG